MTTMSDLFAYLNKDDWMVAVALRPRICARCKKELRGDEVHVAAPDGSRVVCLVMTDLFKG